MILVAVPTRLSFDAHDLAVQPFGAASGDQIWVDGRNRCVLSSKIIHTGGRMRTNIVVDDQLMDQALKLSGLKTKKQAVEEGLRLLIAMKKQESIRQFRGKLTWQGDLDAMRKNL
jgi:Arc/MetJ family transcription regulator